jgi:hypothetical protein
MKPHVLSLAGAAALGFAAAVVCFAAWAPRPAAAQFPAISPNQLPNGVPLSNFNLNPSTTNFPQPLAVQGLAGDNFVVATREPRLVTQIGREGAAQNMLVTVVTHYSLRGDRLIPVEHARLPNGYQLVSVGE